MLHLVLIIYAILSVLFVCLYLSYTFLLTALPDYNRTFPAPVGRRTQQVIANTPFHMVFVLPCLNEEKVIRNTLQAILQLPYKHMTVIVIDDGSDDDTAKIVKLEGKRDRRIRLFQRVLPEARKGKGEALNSCYTRIQRAVRLLRIDPEHVILSIIDGDGRPSENILSEAIAVFANPLVGAAQSRIRIINRQRLLPRLQDVEFATVITAMQNSRTYFGNVGLGGNGQFSRLSTLASLGEKPWTSCLLEDFDLGLRILLKGWKVGFLSESHVAQQGLTSIKRFIRQRARWAQGNMQCLHYIGDITRAPVRFTAKVDLFYFLAQPWLNMFGTILQMSGMILLCILLFFSRFSRFTHFGHIIAAYQVSADPIGANLFSTPLNTLFTVLRLALALGLIFCPGFVWTTMYYHQQPALGGAGRPNGISQPSGFGRTKSYLTTALFFPIYNLLMIVSVWISFWNHITRKLSWAKTERVEDQGKGQIDIQADGHAADVGLTHIPS